MSFTRKTVNFTRKVTHLIATERFTLIVDLQEKTNMTYKHNTMSLIMAVEGKTTYWNIYTKEIEL